MKPEKTLQCSASTIRYLLLAKGSA